jgi:hypothetical protein
MIIVARELTPGPPGTLRPGRLHPLEASLSMVSDFGLGYYRL